MLWNSSSKCILCYISGDINLRSSGYEILYNLYEINKKLKILLNNLKFCRVFNEDSILNLEKVVYLFPKIQYLNIFSGFKIKLIDDDYQDIKYCRFQNKYKKNKKKYLW